MESSGMTTLPRGYWNARRPPMSRTAGFPRHSARPPTMKVGPCEERRSDESGADRSACARDVGGITDAFGGASAMRGPLAIECTSSAVASATARVRCSAASRCRSIVDARLEPSSVTSMWAFSSSQRTAMFSGGDRVGPRSRKRTSISSLTSEGRRPAKPSAQFAT